MSEKMQVIQQKLNETSLEKKSYEKKLNQKNEKIHDLYRFLELSPSV